MSQQITIPSSFVKMDGQNLVLSPSVKSNNALSTLFSNENNVYTLVVKNKREWLKLPASTLKNLNPKGDLILSFPFCKHVDWRVFDFWMYPVQSSDVIPCKSINLDCAGKLYMAMPSNRKKAKDFNTSPLKELKCKAQSYQIRLQAFSKLEKIQFKYDKDHISHLKQDDWFYNSFIIRDCPNIKEIDLTDLSTIGKGYGYLHVDFEKIPDTCIIKINPKLLKEIKGLQCSKNDKNRLNIYCHPKESTFLNGDTMTKVNNIFEEYLDVNGIINITFVQLRQIISEQLQKHTTVKKLENSHTNNSLNNNNLIR